jgi:hypothetical protein
MKTFFKIILILGLLLSIIYLPSALNALFSITDDPAGWQGGIDGNSTIAWFAIISVGYGYLSLQTLLAVFGLMFGFQKRKAAFWLLLLPGIFGIILGLIWLLLLISFDAEWPSSWFVAFVLIVPPAIAFSTGTFIRVKLLRKQR